MRKERDDPYPELNNFEHAVEVALEGHYGQTDHAGEPYILHVFRVMEGVRKFGFVDNVHLAVAALHDVIEDTDFTLDDIRRAPFDDEVIDAVEALTHRKGESYPDYIQRIVKNEVAIVVKMADLEDHLARSNAKEFHKYETYIESHRTLYRAWDGRYGAGGVCQADQSVDNS